MISNKAFIALSAAVVLGVLGPASAALAGNDGHETGGYQVQTWHDIELARQKIQRQIQSEQHKGNAGTAYGYVVSPRAVGSDERGDSR